MFDQVIQVMNDPAFDAEVERLVAYYNITASAKYTLEPRQDFIQAIVRATLEAQESPLKKSYPRL